MTLNREVASYEWVPLRSLARKEARSTYLPPEEGRRRSRSRRIVHNGLVIWGLTERILSVIIERPSGREMTGCSGKSGATS